MKKAKKEISEIISGSTTFKMNAALVIMRNNQNFLKKILKDIQPAILSGRIFRFAQGKSALVLVCEEPYGRELKEKYKNFIVYFEDDLVALTLMSPHEVIKTPGILAHILNLFEKKKINVIQLLTTYTDVTFIIKRNDLFKTMDTLGIFKE